MSYLYDTVEPSVISEEMLVQAVIEQGPMEEAGRVAREEGIEFKDVTALHLDFKNILRIDGLWEFTSVTKLQLDNNIIERIEGIDKLVNLVWLDLSFNNIEVIEGLSTLTKLEDLSLFNNHISRIENLDSLVNLQMLSIGNNDLKELDNLIYLRSFKHLRSLNLSNNPFSQGDEYKLYVAAYLPFLHFLDYCLLDEQWKSAGYEIHQLQIDTLVDDERRQRMREEEEGRISREYEQHKKAFVDDLDSSQLFEALYDDDPDGRLLNQMPDLGETLDAFHKKFNETCHKIFFFGLKEYQKREEEVTTFWECVDEAKEDNKAQGQKAMDEFQSMKKQLFRDLMASTDPKSVERMVKDYNDRVTELWDKMMGLEMTLLEQLEEVIGNFERNMQDIIGFFIENLQGYMAYAREGENHHMERMIEVVQVTSDRVNKSDLDDDSVSDELRMLFIDKDTVNSALQASHDAHLLAIDNKEDSIVTRSNGWMNTMMKEIHHRQEVVRNRARVIEINHYIDHLREEIDTLEIPSQ